MKYISRVKLAEIWLFEKDEKKLKVVWKAFQKLHKLEKKERRLKGGVYISNKEYELLY